MFLILRQNNDILDFNLIDFRFADVVYKQNCSKSGKDSAVLEIQKISSKYKAAIAAAAFMSIS